MCEQAHNYCLLGATNDELAEFFDVSPRTIDRLDRRARRLRRCRAAAAASSPTPRVARGLYGRAVGYDRTVERDGHRRLAS